MLVWVLTITLTGTNIVYTEPTPFVTFRDCKREGIRIVEGYKEGFIKATWSCEEIYGA